jgi:mttA/Hcf106 family.
MLIFIDDYSNLTCITIIITIILIIIGPNKLTKLNESIERALNNFYRQKDDYFK